jgi:hypothetical protein
MTKTHAIPNSKPCALQGAIIRRYMGPLNRV